MKSKFAACFLLSVVVLFADSVGKFGSCTILHCDFRNSFSSRPTVAFRTLRVCEVIFLPFSVCTDRVLLSQVQTLTLQQGALTTARRSSPVPQLQCVGGSAGGRLTLHMTHCAIVVSADLNREPCSVIIVGRTGLTCSGSARRI